MEIKNKEKGTYLDVLPGSSSGLDALCWLFVGMCSFSLFILAQYIKAQSAYLRTISQSELDLLKDQQETIIQKTFKRYIFHFHHNKPCMQHPTFDRHFGSKGLVHYLLPTSLSVLSPAVSEFRHILLSQKRSTHRNFSHSSHQLPIPLTVICHLSDETAPPLILLYTFQCPSSSSSLLSSCFFSLVFRSASHLSIFFFLSALKQPYIRTQWGFLYSFFFLWYFFSLFCSVLGLMPHNPGSRKMWNERARYGKTETTGCI